MNRTPEATQSNTQQLPANFEGIRQVNVQVHDVQVHVNVEVHVHDDDDDEDELPTVVTDWLNSSNVTTEINTSNAVAEINTSSGP